MTKIRVGIIGQGRSGYGIHTHTLPQLPDLFEIAAVADPLEDRMKEARGLGAKGYTDYRDMLGQKDIDLIINATPSHLHVPVTLECLGAGFNTMTEKPAARRASDVDRIVAAARKKGKVLAFFQQSRYAPYFQQVRKVIASGVLGRPVMIKIAFNGFGRRWDWQTIQEYNGGNLLNTGPHPLDQALQLFGTDVMPGVFCRMDRAVTYGDAEDQVKLILSGTGRPTIDVEISSCAAYPSATYQVYATQGGLTGTMDHVEWKYFIPADAPKHSLRREPMEGRAYCQEPLSWLTGSWDSPKDSPPLFDTMAIALYRNLHGALTEGTPLDVKAEEVRLQIAVIEECHRQNPLKRMRE